MNAMLAVLRKELIDALRDRRTLILVLISSVLLGPMVLVALSGYNQESNRQQALEAGFDHYLVKPVSVEELEALLASLPSLPSANVVLLGPPA